MRARTLLVTLAVALLGLLGLAMPASADSYPPAGVRVVAGTVSDSTLDAGNSVTFSGGGFAPGALLRISIDGTETSTARADALGAFSLLLTPAGVGQHVLAASGLEAGGRVRVVSATVSVSAPGSAGGGLPFTGADTFLALLGGLGLVVVGAGVLFVAKVVRPRRPRTAAAAH